MPTFGSIYDPKLPRTKGNQLAGIPTDRNKNTGLTRVQATGVVPPCLNSAATVASFLLPGSHAAGSNKIQVSSINIQGLSVDLVTVLCLYRRTNRQHAKGHPIHRRNESPGDRKQARSNFGNTRGQRHKSRYKYRNSAAKSIGGGGRGGGRNDDPR